MRGTLTLTRQYYYNIYKIGTGWKRGKCQYVPKQSVETHSAWYVIPPKKHPDVDWSVFPDGIEHIEADENGFRGFIVEFYNVVSDVVVQDGYQSVLNFRTILKMIKKRHPRIKTCTRETDGAGSYNSVFIALFMNKMEEQTEIKVDTLTPQLPQCFTKVP